MTDFTPAAASNAPARDAQVLVVGAGPTGLVLALWLARLGIRVRIVDKNAGPGEASRAVVVQARTLELYRQLGLADAVVAGGIKVEEVFIRDDARPLAAFRLGDFGAGLSRFPFALSYPQDDHERFLTEQLAKAGTRVEWNTELVGFVDEWDRVKVTLRGGIEESLEVAYLCGCDGAHSTVRQRLRIGFPGGTYDQVFYVADVQAADAAPDARLTISFWGKYFGVMLPVRRTGSRRLIGVVPDEIRDRETVTFPELQPFAEELSGIRVEKLNWFSAYHVHHRVAEHFRKGRVFLLGDAGHIHSPAGGQGMNTGIGDAVNLSWKLAQVLRGRAAPSLLDTYEVERISFARSLVTTTDRVFQVGVDPTRRGRALRRLLLASVVPFLMRFWVVRRAVFRRVSQTGIAYRDSPLSVGVAGRVAGGDRLPWVDAPGGDNFAPLATLDWQAHVYGIAREVVRKTLDQHGLTLHQFPWTERARAAGLERDALYLIRPDGYVALAEPAQDPTRLGEYLSNWKLDTPIGTGERDRGGAEGGGGRPDEAMPHGHVGPSSIARGCGPGPG